MKITHLTAEIGHQKNLTHFLHFTNCVINALAIGAIVFEQERVKITTIDGMIYHISDPKDVHDLKEFFQR